MPVRDLFTTIEDADLSSRVDSLQDRTDEQQAARDRISGARRWLYIVLTMVSFTGKALAQGAAQRSTVHDSRARGLTISGRDSCRYRSV